MVIAAPLLRVGGIEVVYDRAILAVSGLSLDVPEGGIVALLGANGAGKSTTLKAISGVLRAERGQITRGHVEFAGERISSWNADAVVRAGIVQVLEGRRLFADLTDEENLLTGANNRPAGAEVRDDLGEIYATFPRLKERRRQLAGYLSGGEQQMVAIGRALMARPRLILLDEPSMGLAPLMVREVFETIARLRRQRNVSVLIAEQNVKAALTVVDRGYVIESGRVALAGDAAALRSNPAVKEFYLGFNVRKRDAAGSAHPPL
jgi:branched-chain amino acid transport system ATP-binding protein